ncbi:hypothetical protein HZS61_007031 [Fusarium oxysporum f. sp. conglutinans]|uniref:Uncharacterized protein n=1 Tax=Fusarium oxysporum f. sp. conglutinans TaxID=100902 RepID=A0A8H6LC51_FUSOX|nr:hypothetical protein HZS61_007031 [Fusarium oxysporum f. sp. conglutinans]
MTTSRTSRVMVPSALCETTMGGFSQHYNRHYNVSTLRSHKFNTSLQKVALKCKTEHLIKNKADRQQATYNSQAGNVVELRKGTAVIPLGPASLEPPTYRIDDRDIYTILFDPEAYNGPEVLRADPQRPNNVIDKDTSAGSHASSPGGDRQHVQGTQDFDGPTEDATGDDRQNVHDAEEPDGPTENTTEGSEEHRTSNEDMEKKIQDCLSENHRCQSVVSSKRTNGEEETYNTIILTRIKGVQSY